ncbi:MAG: pantoate--beta-alanine ligase [Armatimonadetes bacterium]|nr:pantoate--beta-alanine ligase [Armatimonadota bacterium]
MKVLRTVEEARTYRKSVGDVAFVPTMGAFHEGHYELMREAKRLCPTTVVSLFVNPMQFNDPTDLDRYPRQEERDFSGAQAAGVDAVFAPLAEDLVSTDSVRVRVSGVADRWEGESRPGHFEGVATIVLKLFNIISASTAVFGLKDLQQCAVVRTMVESLNVPVKVHTVETVRSPDGLALSSRNALLTEVERATAPRLYGFLTECAESLRTGNTDVASAVATARERLETSGFVVGYVALVDPKTMTELGAPRPGCRLIAAASLGNVRLIDNIDVKYC